MNLKEYISDVKDFPKEGIIFKDITPLLNNAKAFKYTIDEMAKFSKENKADVIIGPEARGFLFSSALAYATDARLAVIRKPGKLPRKTISEEYVLEYGTDRLEMHELDIKPGDRVLIVDDVLATGGTMEAIIKLIEKQGGIVVGISFLMDLTFLHPETLFSNYKLQSLIKY